MPVYYEGNWQIPQNDLDLLLPGLSEGGKLVIKDEFSKEGILPYHLNRMYYWLVKAFEDQHLLHFDVFPSALTSHKVDLDSHCLE